MDLHLSYGNAATRILRSDLEPNAAFGRDSYYCQIVLRDQDDRPEPHMNGIVGLFIFDTGMWWIANTKRAAPPTAVASRRPARPRTIEPTKPVITAAALGGGTIVQIREGDRFPLPYDSSGKGTVSFTAGKRKWSIAYRYAGIPLSLTAPSEAAGTTRELPISAAEMRYLQNIASPRIYGSPGAPLRPFKETANDALIAQGTLENSLREVRQRLSGLLDTDFTGPRGLELLVDILINMSVLHQTGDDN